MRPRGDVATIEAWPSCRLCCRFRASSRWPRRQASRPSLPVVERFDNGKLAIRLSEDVEGRDCFLLGTVAPPADELVALLLAADSLGRHGARSVHALLPYLAYARQDRLEAGRSLAAGWLGSVLAASSVEDIVAIDVHSEAARNLMGLPVASLSPAGLFARELDGVVTSEPWWSPPIRGRSNAAGRWPTGWASIAQSRGWRKNADRVW